MFKIAREKIDRMKNIGYNIRLEEYLRFDLDNLCPERSLTMEITKQSIIGDVLDYEPETAQFFFAIGMHCLGCPSARGESIEDACAVHGTDADMLVEQINDYLAAKSK